MIMITGMGVDDSGAEFTEWSSERIMVNVFSITVEWWYLVSMSIIRFSNYLAHGLEDGAG
jgi:hypothetical protein